MQQLMCGDLTTRGLHTASEVGVMQQLMCGDLTTRGLHTVAETHRAEAKVRRGCWMRGARQRRATASRHLGYDAAGREIFSWLDGEVATDGDEAWAATDDALTSVAELLRLYHDAVSCFVPPPGSTWSRELSDP